LRYPHDINSIMSLDIDIAAKTDIADIDTKNHWLCRDFRP